MTGPFSVDERLEILRIELETPEPRHFHHSDVAAVVTEVDRLRSKLAEARSAALQEGAAALDAIAEHVEAQTLAHYNGACGKGSCDMVRAAAETLREMADGQPAPISDAACPKTEADDDRCPHCGDPADGHCLQCGAYDCTAHTEGEQP